MNRALILLFVSTAMAQQPFYTDDAAVTARGTWHFEFFNEFDLLQLQYPNVRQNTANYKVNYGLPFNLELDVDAPYLAIFRAVTPGSVGIGDVNLGLSGSSIRSLTAPMFPLWAPACISNFQPATPAGSSVPD